MDKLILCEQKVTLYETILEAQSMNRENNVINAVGSPMSTTNRSAAGMNE